MTDIFIGHPTAPDKDALAATDAQRGINRWAVGVSILVAPNKQLPYVAPELLEGAVTDEEAARAIAIHSGSLMVNGLTVVINAVSDRLGTGIADLRNKSVKPEVVKLISGDFATFYDDLTQRDEVGTRAIAPGLKDIRPNPFDSGVLLTEFLHSKKRVPLRWLINPLSPPLWIENGISVDDSLESIGVSVPNAHRDSR